MSHASKADKLLIKPAAGARPAPPRTRGQIIPKARTRRPVTRRVTHDTATPGWRRPQTDRPAESYRHLMIPHRCQLPGSRKDRFVESLLVVSRRVPQSAFELA